MVNKKVSDNLNLENRSTKSENDDPLHLALYVCHAFLMNLLAFQL